MSLTSQLDDAGSPITVFLTTALPDVLNSSAAFHAVRPPDRDALCDLREQCARRLALAP